MVVTEIWAVTALITEEKAELPIAVETLPVRHSPFL